MVNASLELLIKYPMVLEKSKGEYHGYIRESDFRVDFSKSGNGYSLKPTEDLTPVFEQLKQISEKQYNSPVKFLDELASTLKTIFERTPIRNNAETFRKILREYSELRLFYINIEHSKLSRDLRTIEITHRDERNRKHPILVQIDHSKAEEIFRIGKCDLPEHHAKAISRPEASLISLYENFLRVVNGVQLQRLFDVLDAIDRSCWVLDPEKPTRKDVHRRIMLDEQVSVVVNFASQDFRDIPKLKFLGPSALTKKYSETVNRNYAAYDPSGDVVLQLHGLLETDAFPRRPADVLADELLYADGDCCVCFARRLNGRLPEVACDNPSCRQAFHVDCLYQWLVSLNSVKIFFEIHGKCPNCEKTIQCPLPESEEIKK